MVKKFFLFLAVLIVFSQIVVAVDTSINVNTLPDHEVMVRAETTAGAYINSLHGNSDSSGKFSESLSSNESQFNLQVWVKEDNSILTYEKLNETYSAGTPIILDAYPEWYLQQQELETQIAQRANGDVADASNSTGSASAINETTANDSNKSPNATKANSLTGFVSFVEDGFAKNRTYIIGGLLVVGFLIGGLAFVRKKGGIRTGSQDSDGDDGDVDKYQKMIEESEKKIKEAKEEMARIKSKNTMSERDKKILEAKKKLIDDEKELMRLREEKD